MAVDRETVRHIARLARLEVGDAQAEALVGELNGILGWIEQLKEIDTTGIEPMTSVVATKLALREDRVTEGGDPMVVLKNAPQATAGFFTVPKVVE
jgi:aspartyl-tRNA(Asn)/glutamyl-tRNA(Gln) amidotransferase subunit C